MNLYEINREMLACVNYETGEIIDIKRFEELQLSKEEKIENACLWIKNLKADIEALKAEKVSFATRQRVAENKLESLKQYVADALAGEVFQTTKVKVSYRKSESLQIDDVLKLPDEYLFPQLPDVDKEALKRAIKQGREFEGAHIEERLNIQIK